MSILKNRWAIVSMILACWALIASFSAGYYWLQYADVVDRIGGVLIYVNIGIDYGNGTRIFHNSTKALTGATLFDAIRQVSNVTYQVYSWGTEVTSLDGVNKQGSFGWTYWIWNSTSQLWSVVWEGADVYRIANEETFMWYYQDAFNPPP